MMYIGKSGTEYPIEEKEMQVKHTGKVNLSLTGSILDAAKLEKSHITGISTVLITCSYDTTQEFFCVGFYINTKKHIED